MKTWPVMSSTFPVSENVARMQSSATLAAMQAAEAKWTLYRTVNGQLEKIGGLTTEVKPDTRTDSFSFESTYRDTRFDFDVRALRLQVNLQVLHHHYHAFLHRHLPSALPLKPVLP